jgi:cell division septum initiation protein DivIVA
MSTGQPRDISRKQRELRASPAERLEAIVEAAERAAESVIDDAEAQARQYLAQARAEADRLAEGRMGELSDLIDLLLGQAVSLRREAERLQETLEDAREQIEPESEAESEPPRLRAITHEEPVPEPPLPPAEEKRTDASGARLLATQMAVSGSSREEIDRRLRNGFEIEDTSAILDAILGPED